MRNYLALFVILALGLSSCATYTEEQKDAFDEEIQAYIQKNKIDCKRSASGMYFNILNPGNGPKIQYKDRVSFTYTGKLLNGKVVDKQTTPVEFQVEELIGAWQEIMLKLRPGGKAFLIAPPQLGYGEHELDDIPQNSILIFEMEVHEVK